MVVHGIRFNFSGDSSGVESAAARTTTALNKVRSSSNSAGLALINVGRIAQDSSFGFIGVANNLNPLLESFQRLRAESGSGKAAMAALGSSLMGAGGLGLALSAVTAIMQFSVMGFRAWTGGAKDAADQAKETKAEVDEVAKAMGESQAQVQHVVALSNAIRDGNTPLAEKKRALEDLKRINKSYFGDLEFEKGLYEKLSGRIAEYTKALILTNVQKARGEEVTKAAIEEQDLRKQLSVLDEQIVKRQELAKLKIAELKSTGLIHLSTVSDANDLIARDEKILALGKQRLELYDKLGIASDKLGNLSIAFEDAVVAALKFKNVKTPETIKKIKEAADSLRHAKIIDPEEMALAQRISDIINGIALPGKKGTFEGGAITSSIVLPGAGPEDEKRLQRTLGWLKEMKPALIDIGSVIQSVGGAFQSMFDAIFTGSKSAFAAFAQALGQIIKKLIATVAASLVLTAILGPLGLVKSASGSALKGLDLFKNIFSRLGGGFAEGGVVSGPQSGYFAKLHGKEVVAPYDKFISMINGNGGRAMIAETVISGNDLRILVREADKRAGRLF